MNVSSIGQYLAYSSKCSGKTNPQTTVFTIEDSAETPNNEKRTVDMRNVSVNEINELIKAGVDGLLDVVPYIPPHIISEYGSEYAADIKVDFLGQMEARIEFAESRGEDTTFLEKVLANLEKIDGMEFPQQASTSQSSRLDDALSRISQAANSYPPQLVTGYDNRVLLGIMALGGEQQIEIWKAKGLEVTEEMILSASDTFQQAFQESIDSDPGPGSISINRHAVIMEMTDVPDWFIQEYEASLPHLDSATREAFQSGKLFNTAKIESNTESMIAAYQGTLGFTSKGM